MMIANDHVGAVKPTNSSRPHVERSIALVGLMGSGKSVVGRLLAKQLKLRFADSDQLVTKMAGVSIIDIFDIAGETKFRDMEFRAIHQQLQKPPHVLATGGGAFCDAKTAALLYNNALVIWLQAKPETLLKRIGDISSRPLLQTGPPLQILQNLSSERAQFYNKAHIHLDTDGLSMPKAVALLLSALDSHLAKQ
mgnify:CR=1 FL=1